MVSVTLVPEMMPVIEPAPLLVIEIGPAFTNVMAAAVKVAVLIVNPVNAVAPVAPTAPVKVVSPVVVVESVVPPATAPLNKMLPVLLPVVRVVAPPNVTAPV